MKKNIMIYLLMALVCFGLQYCLFPASASTCFIVAKLNYNNPQISI